MTKQNTPSSRSGITTLEDLAKCVDYSLMDKLNCDPNASIDGTDHSPRQVFSGHYVPVKPTPIKNPEYVAHGTNLFRELGMADDIAFSQEFVRMFSGDLAYTPASLRNIGWACGYALSIFGTEYNQQCPFQTGNGYGDGRAISVLEAVIQGKRWEMQLKGAGRTPYCRGADGRAVLRSSVREFLAQEHMNALGVPTSRSLSLYVSKTETAERPWYSQRARSGDPDRLISEPVAIATRVAPSFIRVGQLELFARRTRNSANPQAMKELEMIVSHLIDREYADVMNQNQSLADQVVTLAHEFSDRLSSLVANWIRVGYCQGNFNSDNCAAGGFTLDYGPFGFCDVFDPFYQPWIGGGQHFSFLNQPLAAERNFSSFCSALRPLLTGYTHYLDQLERIEHEFPTRMQEKMDSMWANKLGLSHFDPDLFQGLIDLMLKTPLDYTIFFRELSSIPDDIRTLEKSFYTGLASSGNATPYDEVSDRKKTEASWSEWLIKWRTAIGLKPTAEVDSEALRLCEEIGRKMKRVNPKYSWREWLVVPAYQEAAASNYALIKELQQVMTRPYDEQSEKIEKKYYQLKPLAFFGIGGVSHYSCSS